MAIPITSQRENVFDKMRGIAIIGVVYIHGASLFLPGKKLWLDSTYFRWSVPIFLVLSALFSIRSLLAKPIGVKEFLIRRGRKLTLPFFLFSLLYFFLLVNWKEISIPLLITKHFSGYGWSGQYFFIILFQLLLLYPLLSRVRWSTTTVFSILILYLLLFPLFVSLMDKYNILSKIGERLFIYWLPYSVIGAYLAQNKDLFRALPQKFPPLVAGVICVFAPFLIILERKFVPASANQVYILDSVLVSSLLITFFAPSFLAIISGSLGHVLDTLGRYSLGIFCLNPLVIIITKKVMIIFEINFIYALPLDIVPSLISIVYILSLCIIMSVFIERMCGNNLVS